MFFDAGVMINFTLFLLVGGYNKLIYIEIRSKYFFWKANPGVRPGK